MNRKRTAKSSLIKELIIRGSTVSCASISRATHSLMATGCSDGALQVWNMEPSEYDPIVSYTTCPPPMPASAISCVSFAPSESALVAGNASGTIFAGDLTSQTLRPITGHRASINSVDYHPYGEFCASGSLDTNLKLWDLRLRQPCVQTYKGHDASVTCVKHSPDGRWLVSGDANGRVRVWDLTAGRCLQELAAAGNPDALIPGKSAVSGLLFHPYDFELTVVVGHRQLAFWDVESFSLLAVSGLLPATARIEAADFAPDGERLVTCGVGNLARWTWVPSVKGALSGGGWGAGTVLDFSASASAAEAGASPCALVGVGNSVGVWRVDVAGSQHAAPPATAADAQAVALSDPSPAAEEASPAQRRSSRRYAKNNTSADFPLSSPDRASSPPTRAAPAGAGAVGTPTDSDARGAHGAYGTYSKNYNSFAMGALLSPDAHAHAHGEHNGRAEAREAHAPSTGTAINNNSSNMRSLLCDPPQADAPAHSHPAVPVEPAPAATSAPASVSTPAREGALRSQMEVSFTEAFQGVQGTGGLAHGRALPGRAPSRSAYRRRYGASATEASGDAPLGTAAWAMSAAEDEPLPPLRAGAGAGLADTGGFSLYARMGDDAAPHSRFSRSYADDAPADVPTPASSAGAGPAARGVSRGTSSTSGASGAIAETADADAGSALADDAAARAALGKTSANILAAVISAFRDSDAEGVEDAADGYEDALAEAGGARRAGMADSITRQMQQLRVGDAAARDAIPAATAVSPSSTSSRAPAPAPAAAPAPAPTPVPRTVALDVGAWAPFCAPEDVPPHSRPTGRAPPYGSVFSPALLPPGETPTPIQRFWRADVTPVAAPIVAAPPPTVPAASHPPASHPPAPLPRAPSPTPAPAPAPVKPPVRPRDPPPHDSPHPDPHTHTPEAAPPRAAPAASGASSRDLWQGTLIPASAAAGARSGPLGLDPASFLPQAPRYTDDVADAMSGHNDAPTPTPDAARVSSVNVEAVRAQVMAEHPTLLAVLSQRHQALKSLQVFWARGDLRGLLDMLAQMRDPPVAFDLLTATEPVLLRGGPSMTYGSAADEIDPPGVIVSISLDSACEVLRVVSMLLHARLEHYAATGLRYTAYVATAFANVIRDTLSARSSSQRTVTNEEREVRVLRLVRGLGAVLPAVQSCGKRHDGLRKEASSIAANIEALVALVNKT